MVSLPKPDYALFNRIAVTPGQGTGMRLEVGHWAKTEDRGAFKGEGNSTTLACGRERR